MWNVRTQRNALPEQTAARREKFQTNSYSNPLACNGIEEPGGDEEG